MVTTTWLLTGCVRDPRPELIGAPRAVDDEACLLDLGEPARVRVGSSHPVGPGGAPVPETPDDALIYSQLYRTLVETGCDGVLRPDLATGWITPDDGATWVFTLDVRAVFSNGTPLRASDVVAAWRTTAGRGRVALHVDVAAVVEGAVATDSHVLTVRLPGRVGSAAVFASPALSVFHGAGGPPVGSGSFVWDGPSTLRSTTGRMRIEIATAPDPRDLLDRGVDLMIVRQRPLVRYGRAGPGMQSAPLGWDQTYALVADRDFPVLPDSAGWRDRLARDAVSATARGAAGTAWWDVLPFCDRPVAPIPATRPGQTRTLFHVAGDEVGRELAERISALTSTTVTALPRVAIDSLFLEGTIGAVVYPLPREAPAPCLFPRVWQRALVGYRVQPLIDVQSVLLYRPGLGLVRSGAGGVRILPGRP